MTVAAGREMLRHLDESAFATLDAQGSRLARDLDAAIESSGVRACLTHMGSLVSVHFADPPVVDAASARPLDPSVAAAFHLGLMNRGICISPRALFNAALTTNNQDVDRAVEAAANMFAALADAGFRQAHER